MFGVLPWIRKRREERLLRETKAHEERLLKETKAREERRLKETKAHEERLLKETKAREERLLKETKAHEERLLKETKAREERLLKETKAHEERLLKETKAREAELRILRQTRDHQQARALLLTLYELQRTMDPLIAAQTYNYRFCPLTRLPEELLLHIIDFLGNDPVTLHCLQIVSGIFFRLLGRQSDIWEDAWYIFSARPRSVLLQRAPRLQFRRLLQREGRCHNCRHWNDAHMRFPYDDCKFHQRQLCYSDATHLVLGDRRRLYCHPCGCLHDICQFSYTYQLPGKHLGEQRCLGQDGSVQLCEHVQISWASIKAHIEDWRQQQRRGGDWQVEACLNSFNIECHDASHDTRCTASEASTWPQARLRIRKGKVLLILEWTPHSRIDALALTADGRIPAPELRALFQRLRRLGPVDTLYPPSRPGALAEMVCFSPSNCLGPFVSYKTGEDDNTSPPLESFLRLPSYPEPCCESLVYGYGLGRNGRKISIRPHYPRDAGCTGICCQCLAVTYAKDVMVCKTKDITNPAVMITPTHDWLHAMDTRTYPHPQASHIRPQCSDETCTNYYRRRRDYYDVCGES